VHPEDLAAVMQEGSDWALGKQGHKFYVHTPYGQLKFYTQHLADPDLDGETRDAVERILGYRFEFAEGRMRAQLIT
jgi:hypothetical protein